MTHRLLEVLKKKNPQRHIEPIADHLLERSKLEKENAQLKLALDDLEIPSTISRLSDLFLKSPTVAEIAQKSLDQIHKVQNKQE